jgi:hypothetical protein
MSYEERVAAVELLDTLESDQLRLVLEYARRLRESAPGEAHPLEALVEEQPAF